jgi:hypothetical protein
MAIGFAISLLLTGWGGSRTAELSNTVPASPPGVGGLSFADTARLPQSTLSCLCDDAAAGARVGPPAEEYAKQRSSSGVSAILAGIKNTRRLLPIATQLSIKALLEWGEQNGLTARTLARAERRIKKVDRVVLDGGLGDAAAVQDNRPREIRIGSGYAETLISDDEAIFLLAHELTHVAAQTGGLDGLIENVSRKAKAAAGVEAFEDQEEDLACDFIAAQVLKHFIDLYPTNEPKAERLLRTCGYELPSERLAHAWEAFCASYNGFTGDTHHLSQGLTVRALAGLDPELKAFVDRYSTTANDPER